MYMYIVSFKNNKSYVVYATNFEDAKKIGCKIAKKDGLNNPKLESCQIVMYKWQIEKFMQSWIDKNRGLI